MNSLRRFIVPCFKPSSEDEGEGSNRGRGDVNGQNDGLWWYKDVGRHVNGVFSMAAIQANNVLEDQCQLESGPLSSTEWGPQGTFVGIYDGHGGPEAARFVNEHLFNHLKKFTSESQGMSPEVIIKSFLATEEDFLSLVRSQWLRMPKIASAGTCCLVGIICEGMLYIANAGDSRAVLGRLESSADEVKAIQLSYEHNASSPSVREELRLLHPDDPDVVVLKHNVWRVRGIIQVSRSIGDSYLKSIEFNQEPLLPKFRLRESFDKPILKAEPSVLVQKIHPGDQFLIFASDGLWEHLSNKEAVDIVNSYPHKGIARRLIKAALHEAAKKREMRYSDLERIDKGVRRHFHDDITVIVLFIDSNQSSRGLYRDPAVSIKGSRGVT
ncbi:probable protein phosphatase 2C 38 [Impatiens glandulifera]|uniref:probable protein phosphatase 2C 38 n=1 Tax=Impatiens glandulifera TaxID=253017 RepID=UPI001FB1538E|nr:probable protein phosphatase 2C 38 [Impatiens glandulifera]